MKKTCSRLLALGVVLALAGTAHAGAPGVTALLLPQLFGQEAPPAPATQPQSILVQVQDSYTGPFRSAPQPACPKTDEVRKRIVVSTSEMDEDEDCLADLIWDGVAACRMMLLPTRYEGIGALIEVLARVATDKHGEASTEAADLKVTPRCPKQAAGAAPRCEMLHAPKMVSGPCAKPAGCGTGVCDQPACCPGVAKSFVADKACKCCEACKDCACGKKAGVGTTSSRGICGSIVINERNFMIEPAPMPSVTYFPSQRQGMPTTMPSVTFQRQGMPTTCQPLMMHLLPPTTGFHPMPSPGEMPSCGAYNMPYSMLPPPPPPQLVRELIGETPPCLMAELHELMQQREMIVRAIEQVENELARLAQQKQMEQAQAVAMPPCAQKVHLVTETFEAHCDSLNSVGNAPHCMVLQGNVRLTCKKGGQTIRIEAPWISINVQDGTFNVDQPAPVSCPVAPVGMQSGYSNLMVQFPQPPYPSAWTPMARQIRGDKDDK